MKIILKDFYYKGWLVGKIKCDFPQIKDIDELSEDLVKKYILEDLDRLCTEEEP